MNTKLKSFVYSIAKFFNIHVKNGLIAFGVLAGCTALALVLWSLFLTSC